MRLDEKELKEMLKKNKNFLNYNGGDRIDTIVERFNSLNSRYTYLVNNKIIVEYCENLGSTRRYYYLRITKVNA